MANGDPNHPGHTEWLKSKRKFIMALLWFAGTVLLGMTKVPEADLSNFWIWSMGLNLSLFGGANVLEHFAKKG